MSDQSRADREAVRPSRLAAARNFRCGILYRARNRSSAQRHSQGRRCCRAITRRSCTFFTAFLRRAVKAAESNEASAIIFEMNTYGGRLDAAADIVNALNQTKIPTYTFINTNAGSAGAIVAIATQHIFMAPVSAIGAAAPILPTGEDLPSTARDKTISYWSALIRGSAIKNGHNPDIAEAFMNKDKEVKIGDRVVHPKGAVLTLPPRKR